MARPARSRDGPTRRRPPSPLPRPREPGGPLLADRRTHRGWPSRYRNAPEILLGFDGYRRGVRILDPAVQDQVFAAGGERHIGDDQGPGQLADAEDTHGLDAGSQDLGERGAS